MQETGKIVHGSDNSPNTASNKTLVHINWQGWNWFFQSQDKPKRLLIPEQVISIQPTHSKLSYLMLFPTAPSNYVMYNVVYKCLNVLCSTKCVLFNDSVYKTFQKTKKLSPENYVVPIFDF